MTKDPIVEEVRAAREKLFDACGGSLDALLDYLQEREQQDQSRLVSPKDVKARRKSGKASGRQPDDATDSKSVHARES